MRERIGEVIIHLTQKPTPLKSGLFPIYIRVQHKSENRYYSCRCEMTRGEWKKFEKYPEEDHPAMVMYRRFREGVKRLVTENDFSFSALSRIMERGRAETVQAIARERFDTYEKKNSHNTADTYNALISSLNMCFGKEIPVTQMTKDKCERYLRWMLEERGNGTTTASIRARTLTAVLNQAVKQRIIGQNPMDQVKKPVARRRNLAIPDACLHRLLTVTKEEIGEKHYYWLQFWICCYYGNGMNIRDLLRVKRSDVDFHLGELTFVRHKTKDNTAREVHVPLTSGLLKALDAISGGTDYIIPILDGYKPESRKEHDRIRWAVKKVNTHLNEIGEMRGFPKKVTTGFARHCFATILQRKTGNLAYISNAMGHASVRTTQNYLDGYTTEERQEMAEYLKI